MYGTTEYGTGQIGVGNNPAIDYDARVVGNSSLSAIAVVKHTGSALLEGEGNTTVQGARITFGTAEIVSDSQVNVTSVGRLTYITAQAISDSEFSVDMNSVMYRHLTEAKSYVYKIYDREWNYLGVWNDVVSDFGYSQEINSAGSQITVTLARNSDSLTTSYQSLGTDDDEVILTDDDNEIAAELTTINSIGPGTNVDLNLNVKIYEFSNDPTQDVEGDLVFTGFISRYVTKYGSSENTEVSIFSYGADLDNWLLTQDGMTRVPYLSVDPSNILRDVLNKFYADGGLITYDSESITDTESIVTYTFNVNTGLDVVKKTLELAPTDWHFYLDLATNKLHYHPRPTEPSHYFYLGRHIFGLDLEKSMEEIVNDVVVTGGETIDVITDNFFDTNGTNLASHTGELEATWAKHPAVTTGGLAIQTNRVYHNTSGNTLYIASGAAETNDYTITSDFRVLSDITADFGLVTRLDPTNFNGYVAIIRPATNIAEIYKVTGGTWTVLQSTSFNIIAPETYTVEFTARGSRLTLQIDNNTVCDVDDSTYMTNNRVGIWSSAAATTTTGTHLNNFKVKNVGGGGASVFKRYTDEDSILAYRRGLKLLQDNRITVEESADIIASSEINRSNEPRYRSTITIANATYKTRTIKLGQLIGFRNFGNFVDDITMQIVRIDYKPDSVVLQLDTLPVTVPKRLEDIKRNLAQSDVEDNPDAPTT